LLGNHVDYNGGKVLAAAIDRSISVAINKLDEPGPIEAVYADSDSPEPIILDSSTLKDWRNPVRTPAPPDYLRGAIAALMDKGIFDNRTGACLSGAGTIPIGLGLSSSAALCVSLVLALTSAAPLPRDVVLLAQEAEHRAGTPCGTMDQSASVAGGFILFDSSDVSFEKLQPDLGDHVFTVADSGVSRSLGQSSYPVRVMEAKQALELANDILNRQYSSLAEVTFEDLDELSIVVPDRLSETLFRRIRHVVTECARVKMGYEALEKADWEMFGELMTESGRSSATDYEISHPMVEELVAHALDVEGVVGARMMGGGEGGTALILIRKSAIPKLERLLTERYYNAHGVEPGIHVFQSAPGAGVEVPR
jgi:galactokinase